MQLISGGQTGADRAALEVADALGIPHGGWCPAGGWAEDHPAPPGIRTRFPGLRETPSADPRQRTRWNVRHADATLVVTGPEGAGASPGTALAAAVARDHGRPLLVVDAWAHGAADHLRGFLVTLRPDPVLSVAGPRESECPGLHAAARALLESVADLLAPVTGRPGTSRDRGAPGASG